MTEFYLLISFSFNCLLLFIIIPRNCHLLLLLIHINDEKGLIRSSSSRLSFVAFMTRREVV